MVVGSKIEERVNRSLVHGDATDLLETGGAGFRQPHPFAEQRLAGLRRTQLIKTRFGVDQGSDFRGRFEQLVDSGSFPITGFETSGKSATSREGMTSVTCIMKLGEQLG